MSPNRARFPGASLGLVLPLALGLAMHARAAEYTVRPEVAVQQSFEDNAFAADERAGARPSPVISTWNTSIAPAVGLDRKTDTSQVSLLAGVKRRKVYSASELDGTDERLAASIRRLLTPKLRVGLSGHYQSYAAYNAVEEPIGTVPQVLIAERPELVMRSLKSDLTYALDDATELTADIEFETEEYGRVTLPPVFPPPFETFGPATNLLDSSDRSISLGIRRRLSPTDSVGVHLGYGINEEKSADTDVFHAEEKTESKLGTAILFWQRVWSPRWSTQLQGGGRALDSESEAVRVFPVGYLSQSDSGSGFVGGGSSTYKYSDLGQLTVSYTHDTRTGSSSSTGSSAIDIDSIGASLSHRLSSRVTFSVDGAYASYESSFSGQGVQVGATTRLHNLGVRLDWHLRKDLTAYASFLYYDYDQNRQSPSVDRDYVKRVFSVGVRYALEREL